MSDRKKWLLPTIACLTLAALTLVIYWPVRNHEFVGLDDPDYVTENPEVKSGLTAHGIHWAFTEAFSSNWHPLTWMSHMLDCELFGLNPKGPHLENLAWHIANSLLILLFLGKATGAFWRSFVVAALFALHPIHVESVAWVSERKDMLSTFFGISCLLAYTSYVKRRTATGPIPSGSTSASVQHPLPGLFFYILSLFLFSLGLLSKAMLVTWPFLLLVLDFWPLSRIEYKTNISKIRTVLPLALEKLPFLLLTIGSCLVTMWAQRGAISSFETFPFTFRFINAPRACVGYLEKLLWPTNLSVFYRFPDNLTYGMALLPTLLLAGITIAALVLRRTRPYFLSGWFWYLGTLVPVIGIIQVGSQSMADRYTYIPSIGLFIVVTWLAAELSAKLKARLPVLAVGSAALLAICAGLTARQVKVWRTSRTLFEHARDVTDRNFLAAAVLGRLLENEGKQTEALENFRLATQYAPTYPGGWYGMGTTLYALGRPDEGEQAFEQALRLNPDDVEGLDSYGLALLNARMFAKAEPAFVKVLELRPNYAEGHLHLALALEGQDKIEEALPHFQQAVALKPEGFQVHYAYAQHLGKQRKFPEAAVQYQAALQIQPNNLDSQLGLGAALIETAAWENAARQFSAVLNVSPTNSSALDGLGYTLAMRGRPDEALPYFVKAAESAPSNGFPHLHLAMAYQRRNDTNRAIAELRLAANSSPGITVAMNDLAWLLATSPDPKIRDGAEAVRLAEQACKDTKNTEPFFLGTLAAAYAETGRFDDAVRTAEKARDLAKSLGMTEIARRNEELLSFYRSHRPYHEK